MFLFLGFAVSLAFSTPHVVAQQTPLSWRKPNITSSFPDRVSIAGAAIEKAVAFIDSTTAQFPGESYGVAGTFYSQLAEFDAATNQTKYATGSQFLRGIINDGLNYGHAAIIAYTTYKNPLFLEYAKQSWWWGRIYTISQDELNIGTLATKNFTLQKTCQSITMAGGTFYNQDLTSTDIVGLATGNFLVLSALLAEATSEDMYLQAARDSANFIHAHLYSVQNVVQDSIFAGANDSCAPSVTNVLESYNSGLMIEGLAILYSITQNASIHDLVGDILTAAIPNTAWQGGDGIVATGGNKMGDMFIVRGLSTAYLRNVTTPALKSYIEDYLSVQFNAVIDLSTKNGSDIYGGSWIGPPYPVFSGANQTNALQALISSINLRNQTSNSSSIAGPISSSISSANPPPPPPSPGASGLPTSPSRSTRTASSIAPVVGGTLGGLVLLAGVVSCIILWRRSQNRPRNGKTFMGFTRTIAPTINPFNLQSSSLDMDSPLQAGKFQRSHEPPYSAEGPVARSAKSTGGQITPMSPEIPTGELVRLLFQRVHSGHLDGGEPLPGYPATAVNTRAGNV
ncbi:hypothetical protein C8R44DRAFT_852259 [Mycena epipterygia]|nr:hypothetical protein C8R44DRAFT_852259 [Mycena epipterygia]